MLNLLLSIVAGHGGGFGRGTLASDAAHWSGSYRCSDGGWINIASLEPQFYTELITRLGIDHDERFVKGQMDQKAWPSLSHELTGLFATRTRAEWCELLEGTDACFAPVLSPSEAAVHPHMAERKVYTTVDGVLQAVPAPRFSVTQSDNPGGVPLRGAHMDDVLSEIQLSSQEMTKLKASGALGVFG